MLNTSTCSHVPDLFFHSYTVPIPKDKDNVHSKLTCNDFRGIAISPVIAKLFESCVLDIFGHYFATDDNQFGFKKGTGCSHAILAANKIITSFSKGGSTACVAALDVSKAFDTVNHHALFIKLMNRNLPVCLLRILEDWFSGATSCIKWEGSYSSQFRLQAGVRQGSVLAPALFAVYINDLISRCYMTGYGHVIVYADDIL